MFIFITNNTETGNT